ncbi:MAG: hypothetical protein M1338_05185, partial [Patescibacteria group bacterium]|nr:hypothetical protein [Patescibacteria group bacterium]
GGEWYPYGFTELLYAAAPFFLLLSIALVLFFINRRSQTINSWFFFVVTLVFFILTLKSRRYVEYFIPFGVCFSALSVTIFLESFKNELKSLQRNKFFILSPVLVLLIFAPIFYRDIQLIRQSYDQGINFNKFAGAAQWLKNNTPNSSVIFHSDWDEFPILFYHNDWNYYIVGLDPTFMYKYDKGMHNSWVQITTGQSKDNLYQTIKNVFGASYVFVDYNQNSSFDQNLANNFYFKKVFEDKEARIYQASE